ncbi:MAG: alpha/beta fold hydrolase [Hyphomonadaceae bacterium]|nr:alpha/beta fold hydrolase [Hyphomonadaceae bacterium]
MILAWTVAALAAAGVLWLFLNARSYVARAEARWPPIGRFIEADGLKLHIVERGAEGAPALLFLHGANANAREFLPLAEELAADHRVLVIDRPGYGYSGMRRGAQKIAAQAQVAARALESIADAPAIVVCHSLGAGVGLRLALDHPQLVRGLVLIAPASHPYPGGNAWWTKLAANLITGPLFNPIVAAVGPAASRGAIANTFHPAPAPEDYYEEAAVGLTFRPAAFRACAREVAATKREYALQAPRYCDIDAPAIVITGDVDRVVSPKLHARGLARDLTSVELVTLPGAGHMPHRTRPDAVIKAIARVAHIEAARSVL